MVTSEAPNDKMRDVERTFVRIVHFEAGIVPMEKTGLDMRRALNQLEPDEARKLKRRFRKLWRKFATRQIMQGSASDKMMKGKLGTGKQVPSRAERNARKQLVFDEIWANVIEPMVRRFDNAGKEATSAAPAPPKARKRTPKTP
jgi:hypothetical protein